MLLESLNSVVLLKRSFAFKTLLEVFLFQTVGLVSIKGERASVHLLEKGNISIV